MDQVTSTKEFRDPLLETICNLRGTPVARKPKTPDVKVSPDEGISEVARPVLSPFLSWSQLFYISTNCLSSHHYSQV